MLYQRILIFILFCRQCFSYRKYINYSLFRAVPKRETQLFFLEHLNQRYDVNFWAEPGTLNKPVDFLINPSERNAMLEAAVEYDLHMTLILENVQEAFDNQTVKNYLRRRTESFDWKSFFQIEDIYNWLMDLSTIFPDDMKLKNIGKTYEGRDIVAVNIALGGGKKIRPKVFVEGGIHAREWISPAFVTYMINEIVHAPYSEDENLKAVAVMYEWYFVPVLNPDGYVRTHKKDRLWRKNCNPVAAVDLNRNFGHAFGRIGCSIDKHSETYCGPEAFSELETRAIGDYVRSNSKNLKYYISFHSYGQYIIIPYANSKAHVENFDEVKQLARLAAHKIAVRYKTKYTYGTAYDTVGYMTGGVSACWVKKTFSVPYTMIFELPDSGRYGFALPPTQIMPTCLETMDGMLAILKPQEMLSENADVRNGQSRTLNIRVICIMLFIIKLH